MVLRPLTQVTLIQALSIPVLSILIKDVTKVITSEKFISLNKVITHKKLMLTYFPMKILKDDMSELITYRFAAYDPHYNEIFGMTEYVYSPLFLQPSPQLSSLPDNYPNYIVKFDIYYLHYKEKWEMTESVYKPFLQQLFKLISLLSALSHYIIKVMNLLHDVPDTG